MRRWIGARALTWIGVLSLLAALSACEGDMGGAEEHVQESQVSERGMPGTQDTAGGGQGAEVEGTGAPGERLGP